MLSSLKRILVLIRNHFIFRWYDVLARHRTSQFGTDREAEFVVSIASYPKRDPLLPAVFEALDRQTVKPYKWILVLSAEEYEDGLPKHLTRLQNRGIEITWVKNNPYAVKKLVPIIKKYPNLGIVTFDDDIIYTPSVLENLVINDYVEDGCIVGYVGKVLCRKGQSLGMMYRESQTASLDTIPFQVYLIGWGGIYYPPDSLDDRVTDLTAIERIVPGRGSDIWFWGAAIAAGTKQVCLGIPENEKLGIPVPQKRQTVSRDQPGAKMMEDRFQKAIDFYGIRKKILKILPDCNGGV